MYAPSKGHSDKKSNDAKMKLAKYFTNENFPIYGKFTFTWDLLKLL